MLSDVESLNCYDTLDLKCALRHFSFSMHPNSTWKYRHKTLKPCKKELQTKWSLAENISIGHLGWLEAYCLDNRILGLWELKREISAHLATVASMLSTRWQRNFVSVYSTVIMKPTVLSQISHILIFFDTSFKRFGYVVVTILITITNIF